MTTGRINQVVTKPTRPSAPRRHRRSAGRLNRIHKWTLSTRAPEGVKFPMPSLHLRLRSKSDASHSQEATVHQNLFPPRQGVGIPRISKGDSRGMRPSTRNLCSFPSNPTQWVVHNQDSPFLADAPKDSKGWADTSKPQVRTPTQLSRVGSQGAGGRSAATGRSDETSNPPYSIHRRAPTLNNLFFLAFLVLKLFFLNFWYTN